MLAATYILMSLDTSTGMVTLVLSCRGMEASSLDSGLAPPGLDRVL